MPIAILRLFSPNLMQILHVDASLTGIGAVLGQDDNLGLFCAALAQLNAATLYLIRKFCRH